MKKIVLGLFLIGLIASAALAAGTLKPWSAESGNYRMTVDSINTGSAVSLESTTYIMNNPVVGQSSGPGTLNSASYILVGGYLAVLPNTNPIPPSPTTDTYPPVIDSVKFNSGSIWQTLSSNNSIPATPSIEAVLNDNIAVNTDTIQVAVDSTIYYALTGGVTVEPTSAPKEYKIHFLPPAALSPDPAKHTLKIACADTAGNWTTFEATNLTAVSTYTEDIPDPAASAIMNAPNPFNPYAGNKTYISYNLNRDDDITIYIYNMLGQLVWKTTCTAGSTGGRTGANMVEWAGANLSGELLPTGIYLFRVAAGSKQLGKNKIIIKNQ